MNAGYVTPPPPDRMKRPRVAALILVGSVLAWGAGRLAAGATEVSGGAELEVAWTFDTGG